ncbi:MAG: alpha/beta hydrolase [Pseudomonadota bacterium]
MRMIAALLIVFVAGCASAPQDIIGRVDEDAATLTARGATVVDVFVATTRAPLEDANLLFSGERGTDLSFAKVSVSIPPNHQPGQIERPKSSVPNPDTEFALLPPTVFASPSALVGSLNRALAAQPTDERDVLIFVHGYNTDLTSAILRTAQFAHDVNYPGVPVLFSWASAGRTLDYLYDLNSALHARDALLQTGNILSTSRAEGFNVLAHSMGTLVTVEAMRQAVLEGNGRPPEGFRVKNVVLAAPDIDLDLFRKQLDVLPTTDIPIYILTASDDRALALSGSLARGGRVGAADVEDLTDLGVIVIDLSEVSDRDRAAHTKFANAPSVIRVLGEGLRAGNSLETRTDDGFRVLQRVGAAGRVVAGGAAVVVD